MLVLGEVQTTALRHSGDVPRELAENVLALLAGERVRVSERPIGYAVSPHTFTGVDCRIAARSGARVRGVGTLTGRVCLTGGRVLQSSAVVRVEPVGGGYRRAWSHYLARLGVVETLGRTDLPGTAAAHLDADRRASTMGMGAFCNRLLAEVQGSSLLDRRTPVRARRTVLRWAALTDEDVQAARVRLTVREDGLRSVRLLLGQAAVADVVALCEDLALHDWLLTALLSIIEQSQIGVGEPVQIIHRLRPAVDHLLHLWMPAARLDGFALSVWEGLEGRPGLSRQWDASVRRIRDQIAMAAALVNRAPDALQLFR
ncbi:SCO2521 family protein [Micromonospora sp. NPDC048830]|uniref:SCO2521 family protein n=1 Tax=Micromonospora sp. NPDC048830 TaxID=3364257 RepID=UPI0037125CBB